MDTAADTVTDTGQQQNLIHEQDDYKGRAREGSQSSSQSRQGTQETEEASRSRFLPSPISREGKSLRCKLERQLPLRDHVVLQGNRLENWFSNRFSERMGSPLTPETTSRESTSQSSPFKARVGNRFRLAVSHGNCLVHLWTTAAWNDSSKTQDSSSRNTSNSKIQATTTWPLASSWEPGVTQASEPSPISGQWHLRDQARAPFSKP